MGSSLLDNMGQLHIVTGIVDATGDAMTCNDGSATIATNGAGDFTVTFGQAFSSVPTCSASVVDATVDGAEAVGVSIVAAATGSLQLTSWITTLVNETDTDITNTATDLVVHFTAIGLRDN